MSQSLLVRSVLHPVLLGLALIGGLASCAAVGGDGAVPVRIVETDQGFELLRGGEPYFIKGAGGPGPLEPLAAAGGNSTRTWGTDHAQQVLDHAHELGLTVTLGIWVQHPRHGFDYHDERAVAAQRDFVRGVVAAFKDHPALLMWGVGNEVETASETSLVFPEINELAKIVQEVDPDHPTIAVIASYNERKIKDFVSMCPDVDVLGVNAYVEVTGLPEALDTYGYTGPYVVTEFGPRGHWQVARTDWDAPLEPTSTEKAETARQGYQAAVLDRPGQCLGGYVFLWGQKQEKTATWYGMFLESGETTAVLDTMRRFWTGAEPSERAPSIGKVESTVAGGRVPAGSTFEATVRAEDPDGDELAYEWLIMAESEDKQIGGDREDELPAYPELTIEQGATARLRAPGEPGAYRLFVKVTDGTGRAATANTPFYVE
jgi:hypothetical protein